jgi:hypothetical protein
MSSQVVENVPGGYLSREQTMEILEKSQTSIERLVRTGELDSKLFPCPGRRHIRYYTKESVNRFKDLESRKLAVRPPSQVVRSFPVPALVEPPPPPPVPLPAVPWIDLQEAERISGLPESFLRKLCREAKLIARNCGRAGWRLLRKSVEAYEG